MTGTGRVTIDDVARTAGVSRQTVSNVVHGTGRVGAATAERVRAVVDRLGYVVHPGARSLRSLRTGQLAFPLDEYIEGKDDVFNLDFGRELTFAAGKRGYHVLLMVPSLDAMRDLIRSARVDGFVFSNLKSDDPRVALVTEYGTPFACMGRTEPSQRQPWVDIDNAAGIRLAIEHLASRGHRRIVYFGYEPMNYWDKERADAYHSTMKALGLPPQSVLTDGDPSSVARAAAISGDATAVVCSGDQLAEQIYEAAAERDMAIGRDLAVTGFGHDVIGRNLVPSLTTVRTPIRSIVELVMQRFVREVAGEPDAPGELIVPELVVGASTG
ncbi:LacI family DNA-binding transcriptional regulator [Humibacter ginsengiterrae]